MSMKQSYNRYRITFTKTHTARFIGHLDLQSLFQKAIKRAKLPVAYSEGFNPHQLLSFAVPLPLGMAGHAEILEVFLTHETSPDVVAATLSAQLPQGISIVDVAEVPAIGKSAAALVRNATYSIIFSQAINFDEIIQSVLKSDKIEINRRGKKGMVTVDIRPDIFDLQAQAASQHGLHTVLACGSERNLKPEVLAQHILDLAGIAPENCDITYERLKIGLKAVL